MRLPARKRPSRSITYSLRASKAIAVKEVAAQLGSDARRIEQYKPERNHQHLRQPESSRG